MMDDPVAIVMEKLPGRINTGAIENSQRRQRVRDAFIDIVAKVHRLPLSAFNEVGLPVPSTPEEIALSLYAPSEAIFDRLMGKRPFPSMRLIAHWLRPHVPHDSTRATSVNYHPCPYIYQTNTVT